MSLELLFRNFGEVVKTPEDIKLLNAKILQMAVEGRLVEQRIADGSAIQFLQEGSLKGDKDGQFPLPKSWTWVTTQDLCSYIQRGRSPEYSEIEEYPVISQKCIQWQGLMLDRAKFIDPSSVGKYRDYQWLKDGDLLWNSTGQGTLGRIAVYRTSLNPYKRAVVDSHVTVLRPINNCSPEYLFLWFSSPYVQDHIESKSTGSTKQTELSTATIKEHLVPLPPYQEQLRIVDKVELLLAQTRLLENDIHRAERALLSINLATLYRIQIAEDDRALDTAWHTVADNFDLLYSDPRNIPQLRQTILDLAIRGKLVPQDPSDEPAIAFLERKLIASQGQTKTNRQNGSSRESTFSHEGPYSLPDN